MNGHVRARGKGTWVLVVEFTPEEAGGRRKTRNRTFRGSKRAADAELQMWLGELRGHTYREPSKVTLEAHLAKWMEVYARKHLAAKTIELYELLIRVHLKPALGTVPLVRLRAEQIETYYASARKVKVNEPLSGQTLLLLHRLLKQALAHAVEWELLDRNPLDRVEAPKQRKMKRPVADTTGMKRLLTEAEGSWLYIPTLLAIATTMRRGEILGLRWADVNLDGSTLTVVQALEHTKEGGLRFVPTKTEESARTITLPWQLVAALRRQKARQAELRLMMGPDLFHDHGLVVTHDDGAPRTPDNLTHGFCKLKRRAGIGVTFHDLRHSSITALLQRKVPVGAVSERAGHSSNKITLDVYGHVLPPMQDEAARVMEQVLKEALGG